jgi:hypothetical protein
MIFLIAAPGPQRAFPTAWRTGRDFFYLDSPQPFEKSRIGQRNPRKSKLFFLELFGFAWIYLVLGAANDGCLGSAAAPSMATQH